MYFQDFREIIGPFGRRPSEAVGLEGRAPYSPSLCVAINAENLVASARL